MKLRTNQRTQNTTRTQGGDGRKDTPQAVDARESMTPGRPLAGGQAHSNSGVVVPRRRHGLRRRRCAVLGLVRRSVASSLRCVAGVLSFLEGSLEFRSSDQGEPVFIRGQMFFKDFSLPKKRNQTQKPAASVCCDPATVDSLPSVPDAVPMHDSPKQVFSPPISLPESTSTDGTIDNDHVFSISSDEDSQPVPSTALSPILSTKPPESACITTEVQSSHSPKVGTARTSEFDFDEKDDSPPPSVKRTKYLIASYSVSLGTKFVDPKERRPIYQHKWTANDDEDSEGGSGASNEVRAASNNLVPTSSSQRLSVDNRGSETARVHRVKEAHQCLESGEHDDFKQDIEYILSTMNSDALTNVKCLSTLSLGRKCVFSEFRQFLRSEGLISNVLKCLADSPNDQNLAICASTVIYLMSRDFIPMPVDTHSLRLLSHLLRIEKLEQNEEQKKYVSLVWEIFNSYFERMESSSGRKITFHISKEQLTPSSLILDALVFLLARCTDENLKTELLNIGILQWIVGKVEKVVLRLLHDKLTESDALQHLVVIERCFRILESGFVYRLSKLLTVFWFPVYSVSQKEPSFPDITSWQSVDSNVWEVDDYNSRYNQQFLCWFTTGFFLYSLSILDGSCSYEPFS
uniref:WAPL domain-containing protein n=1 Tax=Angiostrongylus cantonensis TaxID=6313 RepID=A0A0K0D0P9_ANGCA